KRARDEKVPQDELDRAKRTIVGSFALQLESPQSLLGNILTQKLQGLPADYWDTYPQKIAAISQDEVQRVARKYLDLAKLQIVAVGDAKTIAAMLKQFGTVEIFDTEGKPARASDSQAPGTGNPNTARGTTNFSSLVGMWNLTVDSPNGQIPLKLEVKPKGA